MMDGFVEGVIYLLDLDQGDLPTKKDKAIVKATMRVETFRRIMRSPSLQLGDCLDTLRNISVLGLKFL